MVLISIQNDLTNQHCVMFFAEYAKNIFRVFRIELVILGSKIGDHSSLNLFLADRFTSHMPLPL